jgi:glycosyltransferase involved in cell wall biosynthesis
MISVLICTYNRCDSLRTTLASLAAMVLPQDFAWEVIVVDNNSSDGTKRVVEDFARSGIPARYLFESTQGKSYALNSGIKQARGDIIAFTDDDVVVDKHWLSGLLEAFERYDCDGVAGRVVAVWPEQKPVWFQHGGRYPSARAIVAFDLGLDACEASAPPPGANWAFRRKIFDNCGLFRTDLGRNGRMGDAFLGGEDTEFFWRITRNFKAKVVYTPTAIVFHPVTEDRTTRQYFLLWCLHAGRSQMRLEGIPSWAVCYFGVPRYYFRSLAVNFLRWLTSLHSIPRFYYKQQTYMYAGLVSEARRLRSGTAAVAQG